MLEFNSIEELRNNKELQSMGRYGWKEVGLEGKEVFACTTNELRENIVWGGAQEILEQMDRTFDTHLADGDLATDIRDFILARLESEYGMEFVDIYTDY